MEEYDDYYEDEEEQYEEGEGEGNEEEEEEQRKPTVEELEYLELRQRIKEQIRKKMQRQNGSKSMQSKKQAADNYGSFFGPSQPVIAQRVIQESKSLLENPHMAVRAVNGYHIGNTDKKSSSKPASGKPMHAKLPKAQKEMKMKVQLLKNTRDYSFLLSEDAQVPASSKEQSGSAPKAFNDVQEPRPTQVLQRTMQSSGVNGKNIHARHEEKKVVSGNSQVHSKAGLSRMPSGSKSTSTPLDSKRLLSSNGGKALGQPAVGLKALPSNAHSAFAQKRSDVPAVSAQKKSGVPVSSVQKKIVAPVAKNNNPPVNKHPSSKMPTSTANHRLEQRRPLPENKAKLIPRQPITSSKPQMNKPVKPVSSHGLRDDDRPKKKPARQLPEDEDARALAEIRKMFNTSRFANRDDDDSDMEANFDDILREERRSAKIARQEDEEQLRLLEEEERRERMRKVMAKKRKLRD